MADLVLKLIEYIYSKSIGKFPSNIDLRLNYSFFLYEHFGKNQEALTELETLSLMKCGIERNFIIFRYQRKIQAIKDTSTQSYLMSGRQEATHNEVAFNALLDKFQSRLGDCCMYYIEFWSQLLEEIPNLNKVKDIGSKIHFCSRKVEAIWSKLSNVNVSNKVKYLVLYGNF